MPDSAADKSKPAPPAVAAAKPPKPPRVAGKRPDLASLAGIAVALSGIIGGLLLEKGSIQDVAQGTAAMIVLGGTLGAVLVTNPLDTVLRAFRGLGDVFFERATGAHSTIDLIIQFATKARKNGIVSLETDAAGITDPFLKKALNLAVDGTDLQELRKMMDTDIALSEQRSESEAKVWESAGGYAPTIGIIGAVMGLIQVMKHLEDIKEVGHGIAVAFVATVYGVGSANIFFLPAGNKLRARMRQASLLKEMMLEGIVGIVEGLNPTLIRMKLDAFGPPQPAPKQKAAPAPKAAGVGEPEPVSART
ncbi:MAG TPA: flagellar motor protein [Candidatus Acidoferrales bacterium]|nr:flagellar motor protein [Candidatus Acidoferrales bacterium]